MEPTAKPIIRTKQIVEILKVLVYCVVFSVLLLLIILAVISRNINISQIFNLDSNASLIDRIKALPVFK